MLTSQAWHPAEGGSCTALPGAVGWRDRRGGTEGVGMLWAELLQDVTWGHAAFPEPTAPSAAPSHGDASPSLPSPGSGPSFFLLLLKAHVHLGSRGFQSPCGHSPSPRKRGAPSERDPPGKAHPPLGLRPIPALTGSPGFAAPRSCAPPGAGCGCYGDACVGGELCQGPDPGPRGWGPGDRRSQA